MSACLHVSYLLLVLIDQWVSAFDAANTANTGHDLPPFARRPCLGAYTRSNHFLRLLLCAQAFKPAVCRNLAGSALRCTANVNDAENVLGTKLATYVHAQTGVTAVRVAKGAPIKVR